MFDSRFCRWILLTAFTISFLHGVSFAAESEQAGEFNLTQFGQLPVRFNGRVATFDKVAENYLRRFGNREVCFDLKDIEYPAVRWLLELMANSDQSGDWRIFRIGNEKLLSDLQLEPHSDGKQTKTFFSFRELQTKFEVIERLRQVALKSKMLTDEDEALRDLISDLQIYLDLEKSFRLQLPDPFTREAGQAILFQLQRLQKSPLPLFIPTTDGTAWQLYFQAKLLDLANANQPNKQNRYFQRFESLLANFKQGNSKAFSQDVEKYSQAVAALDAINGPLQFRAGPAWLEHGVESSGELFYYADANAPGRQVVDMSLLEADDARFIVNYFPKSDVFPIDLVNSWRITLGLVPLPAEELKSTLKTTKVSGRKVILIDNQTPDDVNLPEKKRYLTAILQEDQQTLVFSFYGETSIVAKQIDAHRALLNSFDIKSMKEVGEWFPTEAKSFPPISQHLLAIVVRDDKQLWVFVTSGSKEEIANHRDRFLAFSKSLKFTQTKEGRTKPEWQLPEGWLEQGRFGEDTLYLKTGDYAFPMTITPLGEANENSVDTLIDYWAKKIGVNPLSTEARNQSVTKMRIDNREAYLVDLRPRDLNHNETAKPVKELAFQAPKGWQKLPAGLLIEHSFEITRGDDQAKLTIVALPVQMKDLLPQNINRWRAQIELPVQEEKEVLKATKPIKIDNQLGTLIDLHNPQNKKRILSAVVKSGEKIWYFKMMGTDTLVDKQRKTFQTFLKSVKLPTKDSSETNE